MRMYTKKLARLRDKARELAAALRTDAGRIDGDDVFPNDRLGELWEAGFMDLAVPRKLGGGGAGMVESVVVVEELARGAGVAALLCLLQAFGVSVIRKAAEGKKADKLLGKMVSERSMVSVALSEPEPGPGGEELLTAARRSGSRFAIDGIKTFVSGAREADLVIVFAATNKKAGLRKALSVFAVPAGSTGMLPGWELTRSGLRGAPAVELLFEGVKVPVSSRLGKAGVGYDVAKAAIARTAPLAAALSCGLLGDALDCLVGLCGERSRRPGLVSEFQPMEIAMADISASLDSSRAMAWMAAGAVDEGADDAERLARESKWLAGEAAVRGIDQAARLIGVEGTIKGSPLDRLSRDARAAQVVLGPNHVHRIEVARKMAGKNS